MAPDSSSSVPVGSVPSSEEVAMRKARSISIKEGSAYSVMDGFGLKYISPYALALGATTTQIGILSSLPGLMGNLAQLFTVRLLRRFSRRKIVFYAVLSQALLWLPVIGVGALYFYFALSARYVVTLLIAAYTIMIVAGAMAGPAWNSWMKDLVPSNVGRYFGRRNKIAGSIALFSMLVAGAFLQYYGALHLFGAFAVLFLCAFLGRMTSAFLFTQKYEPRFVYVHASYFSFRQFVRKMWFNNFGRFVLFISAVSFATALASPFFAVYMLRELHFSYWTYTLIVFSPAFTTLLCMPLWGRFADRFGNVLTLRLTGVLVTFVPLLWVVSVFLFSLHSSGLIVYLFFVEAFSGVVWSGFNLCSGNFIYEAVTRERVPLCAAYFNIINASGSFVGALLGGYLASHLSTISLLTPILLVFALSWIVRLVVVLYFGWWVKEVRPVEEFDFHEIEKDSFAHLWEFFGFRSLRTT